MIRARLSISSVLDEAIETVLTTGAAWNGMLIVALLPYRLAQVWFFDRLIEVGDDASRYGAVLGQAANAVVLCFLLAIFGRAVFARACGLTLSRREAPGREAWRVPAAAIAAYLVTASAGMIITAASVVTIVGVLFAAIYNGLAIGTMESNEKVGFAAPFKTLARRATASMKVPIGLSLVFLCAALIAWVNLLIGVQIVLWLSSAAGAIDLPRWMALFAPSNRVFLLLAGAGALLAIEPFWVASYVTLVRRLGSEERGDDLRAWFQELQRAS